MLNLPQRLSLAQRNTPLQFLPRLSSEVGCNIWVKRDDMTGCGLTGNKVRKLEFTLHHALSEGCDTLITCGGVQSNHCRATALLGAQLGMKVHLVLRGGPAEAEGNLLLDKLSGAEISFYPPREYIPNLAEILSHWKSHYQAQGNKAWVIPTGGSDGLGLWGYISCAHELAEDIAQANIKPAAIVSASGSGGTQAGLTVGVADAIGPELQVIGMAVSDDSAYFVNKVKEDIDDWRRRYGFEDVAWLDALNVSVNADYIGPGYGVAAQPVFDTIKRLAKLEGILLDPVYTGKAFHGLLSEIEKGRFAAGSDLVFVHTGGLFGLFAQREQLGLA
ncbi:D-cysteine desulfhydrase family protein [Porticoccus sp. W117]|uniref:D-cysteine desulfhydrase family protein n=1 Tax=Porticoccus sp. W117 TaxID=3054777 RepID=UPI00259489B8|nr:D-cysteine desulfhydrase family protein [Porticoccus sp. W117]MDM3871117.1 D-cysteine desulfhydrase family protein [Porticoccus sp. W117]